MKRRIVTIADIDFFVQVANPTFLDQGVGIIVVAPKLLSHIFQDAYVQTSIHGHS